jgi:hypothetical protein
VEVVVPIAPHDPGVQWFGRRDHHAVPGTVTIDTRPYRCDVEGKSFDDREAFVAHKGRPSHAAGTDRRPRRRGRRPGPFHRQLTATSTRKTSIASGR